MPSVHISCTDITRLLINRMSADEELISQRLMDRKFLSLQHASQDSKKPAQKSEVVRLITIFRNHISKVLSLLRELHHMLAIGY